MWRDPQENSGGENDRQQDDVDLADSLRRTFAQAGLSFGHRLRAFRAQFHEPKQTEIEFTNRIFLAEH